MSQLRVFLVTLAALSLLAGLGFSQTATIVSGNGQLVLENGVSVPMVALIRDAAGEPMANWPVEWSITTDTPAGVLNCDPNQTTDAAGRTSCNFTGLTLFTGAAFAQTTLEVTALASAAGDAIGTPAEFIMTTIDRNDQGVIQIQPQVVFPEETTTPIVGQSGTVGEEAIVVQVGQTFSAVPNVAVQLIPATSGANVPSIQCSDPGGVAYTDTRGVATCMPLFGGRPGSGDYTISVGGGYVSYPDYSFEVTAGPPAAIRIRQGDNQAGLPGQPLVGTLVAEVQDAAGNLLSGVPVEWEVLPAGAGTLTNSSSASDTTGRVSTRVTVGSVPGPAQVRVSVPDTDPVVENLFNFTVNLVISDLQVVGGNNQDAAQGTQFTDPLTVLVNSDTGPVAGATVAFSVESGDAVVLTPNAVANDQGQASTQVQAGSMAGPVVIRAAIGNQSVTFNLTVRLPGPGLTSDSFWAHPFFVQGGFNRGRLAPGSVATIVAPGIAPGINGYVVPTSTFGPLPYELAGVSVQFGDFRAPIYHVANLTSSALGMEFITVQVPFEVTPGAVPVTVSVRSGGSATQTVQVLPTAPAIFETPMEDGILRGVLVRENGSFVQLTNIPAKGEILKMYVSGLGQGLTALRTGQLGNGEEVPLPVVGVGNEGVRVISARYLPGTVGVYEVEFEVPTNAPSGWDVPLAVLTFVNDQRVDSNPSRIPIQ